MVDTARAAPITLICANWLSGGRPAEDGRGGDAQVLSVSCASAGSCADGGYYETARAFYEAFVVSEVNGAWGRAAEVPGTGALNAGGFAGPASSGSDTNPRS